MEPPVDALHDALLSISPKHSFEDGIQILHRAVLARGRGLLRAWRWTLSPTSKSAARGRLSTTHLDAFNQQLVGTTLVEALSWLTEGARELWEEQKSSLQQQQQLEEGAPDPSTSSQHLPSEGLPSAGHQKQLLDRALDLVHLFVDLLYAAAAAEADAVWVEAQQQEGGDLREAAATGARAFQRLAVAGDLAFTLSTTCKLLAALVPSLRGAALLGVANTLAKVSHFLHVWTRCCLYEDREVPASSNPLTARHEHNKATAFVLTLSDNGLPDAAAEVLVALYQHTPQLDSQAVASSSSPAAGGGGQGQEGSSSSSGSGNSGYVAPWEEIDRKVCAGDSDAAAGSGSGGSSSTRQQVAAASSSTGGGDTAQPEDSSSSSQPQRAATSSSTGGDPAQPEDSSRSQEGLAAGCYELVLPASMLLLSATMDHMGHHFFMAGLPVHDDLIPLSECPEVMQQMQVLDTLAAPHLVRLQLLVLALQQYWSRVMQEEAEAEGQTDDQQQQVVVAESGDQQGAVQAAQEQSNQQQQQQQQGSCATTSVPAHCKLYLESFAAGLWSTLIGLSAAARGQWLQQCLGGGQEEAVDGIQVRLNQLRVVFAACDQSERTLKTLGHADVGLLLELCDTQALAHPSDWHDTDWLILLHSAALLEGPQLVYVAGKSGPSLLTIVQRHLDAAAADAEAAMEAAAAAFPQRSAQFSSSSSSSSSGGRKKKGGSDGRKASQAQLKSRSVLHCNMLMHVLKAWTGCRATMCNVPGRTFVNDYSGAALQQQAPLALLRQQEACCRLPNLLGVRLEATMEVLPLRLLAMVDLLETREGQHAALSAVSTFSKYFRVTAAGLIMTTATRTSASGSSSGQRHEVEAAVKTLVAAGPKGAMVQQLMDQVLLDCANGVSWGLFFMSYWAVQLLTTAAALLHPGVRQQALRHPCRECPVTWSQICWQLHHWKNHTEDNDNYQQFADLLGEQVEALQVAADQVAAAAESVGALHHPMAAPDTAVTEAAAAAAEGDKDTPQPVNSMATELHELSLDKDGGTALDGSSSSSDSSSGGGGSAAKSEAGIVSSSSSHGDMGIAPVMPTPHEVEMATAALVMGARVASLLNGMPARIAWLKLQALPTVMEQSTLASLEPGKLANQIRWVTAWVLLLRPLLAGLLPPEYAKELQVLGAKWEAAGGPTQFNREGCRSCSDEQFGLTADEQAFVLRVAGCVVVPNQPGCWHPLCLNLSGLSETDVVTRPCNQCRRARYCSRECQVAHWKMGHKATCKPAAAAAAAGGGSCSGADVEGAVKP